MVEKLLNMKTIHFLALILFFKSLTAQELPSNDPFLLKKSLDTSDFNKWPSPLDCEVSPNGKYTVVEIDNMPAGKYSFYLKGLNNDLKKTFVVDQLFKDYFFTANSRKFVFRNKDSLLLYDIGRDSTDIIENIVSFKAPTINSSSWLAYKLEDSNKVILTNLISDNKFSFNNIIDYSFDLKGSLLLLRSNKISVDSLNVDLINVRLSDVNSKIIWSCKSDAAPKNFYTFAFNQTRDRFALVWPQASSSTQKKVNGTLWYFEKGMKSVQAKLQTLPEYIGSGFSINNKPSFSKNSKWIFFNVEKVVDTLNEDSRLSKVDVWSYRDEIIQPEQQRILGYSNGIITKKATIKNMFVVGTENDKVVKILDSDEWLETIPELVTGDYVVLRDRNAIGLQYWWHFGSQSSIYVASLADGSRRVLKTNVPRMQHFNFCFSPNGKFLVYWDSFLGNYFCYDILSSKIQCLTSRIKNDVIKEPKYTLPSNLLSAQPVAPVAGWEDNSKSLLIYGLYDIWKLDPNCIRAPINITNGLGRTNHIKLALVYGPGNGIGDKSNIIYNNSDSALLTAFDIETKYNGFGILKFNDPSKVKIFQMAPYTFYRGESQRPYFHASSGWQPKKVTNSNDWIVWKESATEFPNFYCTSDFNNFRAITEFEPQKQYIWHTIELVKWKQFDGTISHGLLYKPENFNPKLKYPLIFHFYHQFSDQLYTFHYPNYTFNEINIAYFLSKGYLVFQPDIHYSLIDKSKLELIGQSAYNSVVSAALYLSKRHYVDPKRMGLQAHSFGAAELNYIITKTKLFSAAAEFAGVSDPVHNFLTLTPFLEPFEHSNKLSRTEQTEGYTPWERPDLYFKASTVLNANKITAPLLITHNKNDNQIQWRLGLELYMALRRLGKTAWMLQYDDDMHSLSTQNSIDYTIRLNQFFDHYLMYKAPPKWMTSGVPTYLKGKDGRYNLDPSGNCGKDCKVCKMWNEKMKKDSAKTMIEIREKIKSEHWTGGAEK
jgi:hypothetical protein